MAITSENLVKFGYGLAAKASAEAGHISFASDTRQLFVGDGTNAVAFAGNVANAVFADKKLTITYNDGTESAVLDFSDVASAEGVSSLLGKLRTDVNANTSAITEEANTRALADSSIRTDFAAADTALSNRIAALETGDASVGAQIAEAIGALDSSKEAEDASKFVKVKVDIVDGILSENGVVVTTNDIASAEALATHTGNGDIHVTSADKTNWNAAEQNAKDYAKELVMDGETPRFDAAGTAAGLDAAMDIRVKALEAIDHDHSNKVELDKIADGDVAKWNAAAQDVEDFFNGALSDGAEQVKDTLKEIQEYIASDATAAATMTANITKAQQTADKGVADASAAKAAADAAQATADAAAVKATTDASLALKADASVVYTKTEINNNFALKTDVSTAEQNAKSYADGLAVNYDASGAAAGALDSAKAYVDGKVDGKFDASGAAAQALVDAKAYANGLASNYDAAGSASAAEAAAKSYADAITVNGQVQTEQEITISGADISIGGTGNHAESNVAAAIEDLYTEVGKAANAGVQSLSVNADSSVYAGVNAATGAVTLTIKKVAIADATAENTGVADAFDVKSSIETAKTAAVSTVVGKAEDASSADTVYGAKAYAKAYTDAALKWTILG